MKQTCFAPHQPTGLGLGSVPAGADRTVGGIRTVRSEVWSRACPVRVSVNGKAYNGVMPPVAINDEQIANVPHVCSQLLGKQR